MNRRIVALALLGALGLSQAAASSAAADEPVVTFDEPHTLTLEYGEYWYFTARAAGGYLMMGSTYSVDIENAPASFEPEVQAYDTADYSMVVAVSTPYDGAPLTAGTYTINVTASNGESPTGSTSAVPATLTIKPAALGIELRIVPDSTNSDASIVTARFTGRFADEYQSSFFPAAALSPAGVWHITIKDENSEVVTERSVERAAGDDVLATSFYWPDAAPGVQYTASADFVPSGSSASNFTIASATDFPFTGSEDARPVPTSTATGKPDASLPEATEFGLPLWSIIVIGVLIVGFGVLVTVLSVRLSRRSVTSPGEVAA